ncbi:MAG TPA: Ig-like domain-containing protein, partial [Abditibacteriaceae bacterium]
DTVSVRLYRYASSTATAGYWNGSSWDATYDAVQHEKRANGTAAWNLLLPNLATGKYKLRAAAKDKVANTGVSSEVTISVDNGVPANVAITTPAAGTFLNKLPVISVVATDDSGGSGIGRVDLALKQMSTGKYWTGSAWGAETALATTFSTKGWQSAFSLPIGLNLPNGNYQIIAKATDKVGLSQSITNTVTVDITAPTVTIANPASLGVLKNLPSATGSAADDSSQVKSIRIRLYRYASSTATAGYWNGSSWDAAYNSLTHQLSATGTTTWNRALLVNSASRVDGKYYIQATATDGAGNAGSITHTFWLDSVAPQSVTIDTPPTGAKVKTLSTIAGRCVDNTGGQGIARTELRIRRDRDLVYWTGSGWTATLTALPTELSGTSWRRNHSSTMPLPTGVDLSDGAYTLVAIAYDKAGNSRSASATIAVDQTLPTVEIINPRPDASYKQLSSITGTSRDLGTGISKVTVRLYRYASSTAAAGYWAGGDNWTATYSAANELAVSGTTSWSLALPLLNEGKYYCLATATDKAGNSVKTPVTSFVIDRTLPTVAITRPATNPAFLRTLPSLAGTASDSQGLAKVSVRIYRYATLTTPAGYWAGGENWTTTYSAANEHLAIGTTSWSLTLPTLPDGRYYGLATATDKAGNSTSTVASVFTVDSIAPSVAITRPATNPAFSTSLPSVTGTAADAGGLAKVTVRLFRTATSTTAAGYWAGGENWTSTYSAAANELPVNGLFSWSLTLPPLAEGKYYCLATATDKAANTAVTASHVFTIDRTLPTVAIAQPAVDNQILQTLPAITGAAYDQVGIGKVTVRLYRYATATTAAGYWAGGENWTSTYSAATNQILATGTTSWNLTLPHLAEGKYYCLATATDMAGNSANTPARAFIIDVTAPEVLSITSPVEGAFVKSLSAIAGTANDTVAGLDRVEIYLQRADGRFWTGVNWSDAKALPTSYDSVNAVWSSTGSLPTGDLLSDGEYTITAQAFDKVSNQKSVVSHFTVDTTAPVVSVSNPQNNGAYAAISEASGTASDSGSGVARVTVALFRDATLTTPAGYWNGASWNETYDSSLHELTATGTTDWSFTLPRLEIGSYTLRATAIDVVGNSGTSDEVNFTLIAPPVENQTTAQSAEASPVVLSSAEAYVASSQVQLLFTDGLKADSANNVLNYRVSVNNQEVPLNSARYDAATNRVTLQLPTNALRSGDQVVAFWQGLLDEQGRAVTGQTEVLVAR